MATVTVNIKMYRVEELGDCFLMRFTHDGEKTHVLIDCGSYWNSNKSKARMKTIATDIKKQLNGDPLDVIVGTHQHNDHLSGFIHAQKEFEDIAPEQVWLSWLDDPKNKQARKIGEDYNNYLTSLQLISKELKKNAFYGAGKIKQRINGLLGFYGIDSNANRLNAKEKGPADLPQRARVVLQSLGKKKPDYLSPGDILNLPGISGGAVKVYVLGPPKNEDLLYVKEPKKNETFDPHLSAKTATAAQLLGAMKKLSGTVKQSDEDPFPFNEPYRSSSDIDDIEKIYLNRKEKWRQIDLDWLKQAEQLALWLDGYTNNSSLVLAFEIVKTNKVLLFAADAQAGNWNSWREVKWKKMPKEFNWLTLLKNTVLYKTGHHGSHNSTLVEGLNNMTHEELVVMIPVDKADPMITKKNGWKMPATNLYKELKKRSQYRIIRMDDGISKAKAWKNLPHKPSGNKLFWEYEVRG